MRSNSASDERSSTDTSRRRLKGKNSRVCSVVKATTVPAEIDASFRASTRPATRYTRAGVADKKVKITV